MRQMGVDALIRESEEVKLDEAIQGAREPQLSVAAILEGLNRQIRSKHWWLQNYSTGAKKRPDHELRSRRHELAVLVQARAMIARGGANAAKPPT